MSLIDKGKRFMTKVSKESSFQLNEEAEEYILDEEVDSVEIEELNEEDNKELENDIELEALDFINNMDILENYLISKSSEIFIDNLMENLIKIITRGNRVGMFIIAGNSLDVKTTDLGKLRGILKAISEEEFNNKLLELKRNKIMHSDKK